MNNYARILYVARATRERGPAFERAAALAISSGARLHLCLIDYSRSIALAGHAADRGGWLARKEFLLEREAWLAGEVAVLRGRGIEATADVTWSDDPAAAITEHAERFGADLVIKDATLGPLDRKLLRSCSRPLLLVRPAEGPTLIHRVFAAVDVTHGVDDAVNQAIGDEAVRLAEQSGAALHFVHGFDTSRHFASEQVVHEKAFEQFLAEHGVPERNRHFVLGRPADKLAGLADGGAGDVLVFGTPRSLGLERARLGHTADALLDQAGCDVLVVRPPPTAEPAASRAA